MRWLKWALVAVWLGGSSPASACASSRAAAASALASTTRSRKPAAMASCGPYIAAVTTRWKLAGCRRWRASSIANHGTVRPILISLRPI